MDYRARIYSSEKTIIFPSMGRVKRIRGLIQMAPVDMINSYIIGER